MCDSTFKLEMIGINLPVNLNLNFQTWKQVQVELASSSQARRQLLPGGRGAAAQTASIES